MPNRNQAATVRIREVGEAELAERTSACPPVCKSLEPVAEAVRQYKELGYINWRDWSRLTELKAEATRAFRELFKQTNSEDLEKRIQLSGYLAELGASEGRDFLFALLKNPDAKARQMVLANRDGEKLKPRDSDETELLLSFLRDEDTLVQDRALEVCFDLDPAAVGPAFLELYQDENYPRRDWVLFWLLKHTPAQEHLDAAIELLNPASSGDETGRWLRALCEMVLKGPPGFAAQGRKALESYYVNSTNKHRFEQGNVRSFVDIANSGTLTALETIFEKASDSVSRHYALVHIAKIDAARSLELLARQPDRHSINREYVRAFRCSASEQQSSALVKTVLDKLSATREKFVINEAVIDLLLEHGHQKGRSVVKHELPALCRLTRMYAAWQLNRWTIEDALRNMQTRGIIDSLHDLSVIEKIRQEHTWTGSTADPEIFFDVLLAMGILREVSSEAQTGSPDHCDLLAEFSQITDGVFSPRSCRQIVIKKQDEDDPTEEDYFQISFVVGNLLFEFEADSSTSDYRVAQTAQAVEAALARSLQPKRLVQVYTGEPLQLFFWGEPGMIIQFCRSYGVPLMSDFDSP